MRYALHTLVLCAIPYPMRYGYCAIAKVGLHTLGRGSPSSMAKRVWCKH